MQKLRDRAVDAAAEIGHRLCGSAIDAPGGRTWLAYDGNRARSGTRAEARTPAGPSLYSGSAGIALFLMELYGVTGDAHYLTTGQAALSFALGSMHTANSSVLSTYTGQLGVAYAAARAYAITGSEEWRRPACAVVNKLAALDGQPSHSNDLLSGAAGAICALLAIGRMLDLPHAERMAMVLGDALIASAIRRPSGLSWRGYPYACRRDLTGLAHGASGGGVSLLALHSVCGDYRFRVAAEEAFDYEDAQFDHSLGNWPDHREAIVPPGTTGIPSAELLLEYVKLAEAAAGAPLKHYTSWCNGAPGIGIARAAGFHVLGHEKYRMLAIAAARTTVPTLCHSTAGQSICHGTLGNAECVSLIAASVGSAECAAEVSTAVEYALERHRPGEAWQSGTGDGIPDPTLFLGEAGTGMALLRFGCPSVPTVVLAGCQIQELQQRPADSPDAAAKAATLRQVHVRAFLGLSLAAVEAVGTDDMSVLTGDSISDGLARLRALRQHLHRAAMRDPTGLIEDALTLETALLEVELEECNEALHNLRRDARRGMSPDLSTDSIVELTSAARVVRQQYDWERWLKAIPRHGLPTKRTRSFVVFNNCGRAALLPVGELEVALIACLSQAMSVAGIVAKITDLRGETFHDTEIAPRVAAILTDYYRRGLVDVRDHTH